MAGQRNRIIKIKEYIESFGICVNIGKTKACGNKGIFKHFGGKKFRIDVSKEVPEENIIPVLIHEFAHYIHYSFDPELKSLDFVFGSTSDVIEEELIKITVNDIPKDTAASLFNQKKLITAEIKQLVQVIKAVYPDFKLSSSYKKIERTLTKPVSYLLKYDKVKIFNTVYSVEHLSETFNYL